MKKLLFIPLMIVLSSGLLFGSCAESALAPAPAPAPTPAPAPAPAKTIELRLATHLPPMHYMAKGGYEPWIKEVEERTGGRVKITLFTAGALGRVNEAYDLALTGIVDITQIQGGQHPGLFPMNEVFSLPYLIPHDAKGTLAMDMVMEKYIIPMEFSKVKVLWYHRFAAGGIHSPEKPIRTIEDAQGLVLGYPGGEALLKLIKAVGASPEVIYPPAVYNALERGMVDGMFFPLQTSVTFRLHEVEKYYTETNTGGGTSVIAMNLDTWNSLPPDIQKIMDELNPWVAESMYKASGGVTKAAVGILAGKGIEIIELSPEEMERWIALGRVIEDDWVAEIDAKGLPGTQMVNDIKQILSE